MKRYFQRLLPSILVLLTTLAIPELAFASDMPSVRSQLHSAISQLFSPLQTATKDLFYALAAVEIAVFFLNHVLKNRGHEELFTGIIKKTVTLMFFMTLIDQAGVWLPAIVNGIGGAGSALGEGTVTAGTIAEFAGKAFLDILGAPFAAIGNNISTFGSDILNLNISGAFSALGKAVAGINPVEVALEELMALVIALLVGISILWLALEYIMVQVESYLVLTFGVIMLAGGGLRWTTKYVSSYFDYAVNVGVRLFLITVIAYLDSTIVIDKIMVPMLENVGSNFLQTGFNMLTLGAIMALLPKRASSVANSILSGQSTLSGGDLGKSMMQVGAGTALAGAAVAGGAVLAGGAAAGAVAGMGAGSMGAASTGASATASGAGTMTAAGGTGASTSASAGTVSASSQAASVGQTASQGVPAPKIADAGGKSGGSLPTAKAVETKPGADSKQSNSASAPQSSSQSEQKTEQGNEAIQATDAAEQASSGAPAPATSPAPANAGAPAPQPSQPTQQRQATGNQATQPASNQPAAAKTATGGSDPATSSPATGNTGGNAASDTGGNSVPVTNQGSTPADGGSTDAGSGSGSAPANAGAPAPSVSERIQSTAKRVLHGSYNEDGEKVSKGVLDHLQEQGTKTVQESIAHQDTKSVGTSAMNFKHLED